MKEAKVIVQSWRLEYNNHRPHHGLVYMTPLAGRRGDRGGVCGELQSARLRCAPPVGLQVKVDNSLIKVGT